jgi:hypothetical protein
MTTAIRMKNWRSFLRSLKLEAGGHSKPEQGMCLLEAIAYIQDQPFSDHPQCVSPVIGAFGRSWNDSLDDAGRQRLKAFIPDMIGTATTSADETTRAWLATDWLVRTFTPAWLDKAGLTEHAAKLRGLDALTSTALARQAQPIIEEAKKASYAAGDAAGAAAGAAARAAAWAAAGAAAGDAAWAAAWDAAGAAARAAASKKKGYNAQYYAAYEAAKPLMDIAVAATVKELNASAEDLLRRMCAVGRP